jgi:hypothetical protein
MKKLSCIALSFLLQAMVSLNTNAQSNMDQSILRLSLQSGDYSDETALRFMQGATEGFDGDYDAYKLLNQGNSPSLYTVTQSINYSINSLPFYFAGKNIPLKALANFSGTYTLNADFTNFAENDSVILWDQQLNIHQNLKSQPLYSFQLNQGDTTSRFSVYYRKEALVTADLNASSSGSSQLTITAVQQDLTIYPNALYNGSTTLLICDTRGSVLLRKDNVDLTQTTKIRLPIIDTGIYIVKIETPQTSFSKQVYLSPY